MKKINAFYCIKTPSDWKESVLMYDKPTEKKKTKLTGFQLAGAVLAAILLVAGGAMTLYRSGDDFRVDTAAGQSDVESVESTETNDISESEEDVGNLNEIEITNAAQKALDNLLEDHVVVAEGIFGGCDSFGYGYLLVDRFYTPRYLTKEYEQYGTTVYEMEEILSQIKVVRFSVDFRATDMRTGKSVYTQSLEMGREIAIGAIFDESSAYLDTWNCDAVVTGLDYTTERNEGIGSQVFDELTQSVIIAYNLDTSTVEGSRKLESLLEESISKLNEVDGSLQCSELFMTDNTRPGFGIGLQFERLLTTDNENCSKLMLHCPFAIVPYKDYKNTKVEVVLQNKNGVVIKVGEKYYSITTNFNDVIISGEAGYDMSEDGFTELKAEKSNVNYSDTYADKRWMLDMQFEFGYNTVFPDDLKIYMNAVEDGTSLSDKTDDSDVVMTYKIGTEKNVDITFTDEKDSTETTDSKTE